MLAGCDDAGRVTVGDLLSAPITDPVLAQARAALSTAVLARLTGTVITGLRPLGDYLRARPGLHGPVAEHIHRLGYEANSSTGQTAGHYLHGVRLLIDAAAGDPSAHCFTHTFSEYGHGPDVPDAEIHFPVAPDGRKWRGRLRGDLRGLDSDGLDRRGVTENGNRWMAGQLRAVLPAELLDRISMTDTGFELVVYGMDADDLGQVQQAARDIRLSLIEPISPAADTVTV